MKTINTAHLGKKQKIYDYENDCLDMEVLDEVDEGTVALGQHQQFKLSVDKAINSLVWHISGEIPIWFYATPNHTGENEIHFQIMSKLHNPDNLQGADVTGTATVSYEAPLTFDKYLDLVEGFIQRNFR